MADVGQCLVHGSNADIFALANGQHCLLCDPKRLRTTGPAYLSNNASCMHPSVPGLVSVSWQETMVMMPIAVEPWLSQKTDSHQSIIATFKSWGNVEPVETQYSTNESPYFDLISGGNLSIRFIIVGTRQIGHYSTLREPTSSGRRPMRSRVSASMPDSAHGGT